MRRNSKTGTEVGPLQDSHGDLVNDKKLMSDLLLSQFSSVFTTSSANHVISDVTSLFYADEHSNLNLKPKLTTINFTKDDVESAIKSLKINSAPGPDGMPDELLTNCASVISEPLSALFTKSLNEGSVPTLLKRTAVVPIYKGGDRSLPSNYKPVSLTPIGSRDNSLLVVELSDVINICKLLSTHSSRPCNGFSSFGSARSG